MTATTVILDGVMGKKFGEKWELYVNSPAEALRMVEANKPGFSRWVRDNLDTYEGYEVTCEYANGVTEIIGEEELTISGRIKSIRFTPVINGSGNTAKIVLGVIIIAIAVIATWGVGLTAVGGLLGGGLATAAVVGGAGLILGGIVGLLTPQPTVGGDSFQSRTDKTSYYFNGPVNTTMQGVPVPLIYGRCLVGSHVVSVNFTVDEATA